MTQPSTSADTIASAARGCAAFTAAHRLATWVGEGKRVTPKHVLRPVDVPGAARELGISVPTRIRTAAAVPALHRPWRLALTAGFLRIADGHARPGPALAGWPGADDDAVCELWLTGLTAAFAATWSDADDVEAAAVVREVLRALTTEPPPEPAELERHALAALGEDAGDAYWLLPGWCRPDDRRTRLELLTEFGAADRHGSGLCITPLGRWAFEVLQARAPRPITADLPAAELLARLAGVEVDLRWPAAQRWLAERGPLPAAQELLRAAAVATPAQRLAAVNLVCSLGEPAEPAWAEAAADPNLAAHARAGADMELTPQEVAWLAVEYATAALHDQGPDEALSCLDDMVPGDGLDSLLRAVEPADHPAIAELAEALTAFLASGVTPTSAKAVQLKISLNRFSVWRRVLLPATATLGDLHEVIQIVMGWDGDHLHAFTVGRKRYGDPFYTPDVGDEEGIRCAAAFAAEASIGYLYDFGASWDHTISCEKVLELAADTIYPVCVAGRGDAPVEDWTGGPESTPFDQDAINRRLARTRPLPLG